jgi:hypothetical protein
LGWAVTTVKLSGRGCWQGGGDAAGLLTKIHVIMYVKKYVKTSFFEIMPEV